MNTIKPTVQFEIKQENDSCSILFYRAYNYDSGQIKWSYIDSFSPMSKMELHTLKNFLQEYLHNNDWD